MALVNLDDLRRLLAEAKPEPRPSLLDRSALARELSVSESTLDRLRRQGLPTIMVCEAPRFDLEMVRTWLFWRSRRTWFGRMAAMAPVDVEGEAPRQPRARKALKAGK